jgi:hypothetical protein
MYNFKWIHTYRPNGLIIRLVGKAREIDNLRGV